MTVSIEEMLGEKPTTTRREVSVEDMLGVGPTAQGVTVEDMLGVGPKKVTSVKPPFPTREEEEQAFREGRAFPRPKFRPPANLLEMQMEMLPRGYRPGEVTHPEVEHPSKTYPRRIEDVIPYEPPEAGPEWRRETVGAVVEQFKKFAEGYPPETVKQTVVGAAAGFAGFGADIATRVAEFAKQAAGSGKMDWGAMAEEGWKASEELAYEVTDPGAQVILGIVTSIPAAAKMAGHAPADWLESNYPGRFSNLSAGLRAGGDIAELIAFGWLVGKLRGWIRPEEPIPAAPYKEFYGEVPRGPGVKPTPAKPWWKQEQSVGSKLEARAKGRQSREVTEAAEAKAEPTVKKYPKAKAKKAKKVRPEPEPVVEKLPIDKELPPEKTVETPPERSPFYETAEENAVRRAVYDDPATAKRIDRDVETFTTKLTHFMNRWIHGDDSVEVEGIRSGLSEMAARSDELWHNFHDVADHRAWVETVKEAAEWARRVKRPGVEEIPPVRPVGPKPSITKEAGIDYFGEEPTLYAGPPISAMAKQVKGMYDILKATKHKPFKQRIKETKESFIRKYIDRLGNIKRSLAKEYGEAGYKAIEQLALSKGGGARAASVYNQALREVYRGLDRNLSNVLDNVIFSRRVVQIDEYRKDVKHPSNLGGVQHRKYLDSLEAIEKLKPGERDLLVERADAYFDIMKDQLKQLHDEGLITDADYGILKRFDYSRRQLIDKIDPEIAYRVGERRISVRESGVEELAKGRATDLLETDSKLLMLEVVSRTQGRIMANRANKALLELARTQPDGPLVRIATKDTKVPRGWSKIYVFEKGERKALYMPENFAKEWVLGGQEMSYRLANLIRIMSGSVLLRPMATGINVGFAFSNLPRDIAHIFLVSNMRVDGKWKSVYSPHIPVAIGQMAKDMAMVFPDVVMRKGRVRDYYADGGAMEFLVHQGRLTKKRVGADTKLDKVQDVLGYISETSELLTRVALRERALKKGADRSGASFVARNYMDFGEGGSYTKALDSGIPYLNAAVVATRGVFRSAQQNPATFGYKIAQLAALNTGLYLANRFNNPEAWESTSDMDKQNNFILTTPWTFEDEQGQTGHFGFKVPKDPSQKFFSTAFEYITAKWLGDDVDIDRVVEALKELSPVSTEAPLMPPSLQAIVGYITNKDFWLNEDIWKGPKVEPGEEYDPETHPFYVAFGQQTNLSPERFKAAMQSVFTRGNIYSHLVGWGYKKIFGGLPRDQQEQAIAQALAKVPITRRFMYVTHPYSKWADKIDQVQMDDNTTRWIETRNLDVVVEGYLFHDTATKADVRKEIKSHGEKHTRDRLFKRFMFQQRVKGLGERSFWLRLQRLSPEGRARIFNQRWSAADKSEKGSIRKEMSKVPGLFSDRFWTELRKVRVSE